MLLLWTLPLCARVHHSRSWAESQFALARRLQETLETRAVQQRTRLDYQRVVNAYRRIYLGAPGSSKADPSVVAGAQLMEEMGRCFQDDTILRSAIREYEFLLREYPASKSRFDALFRIGEIYRDDLNDKAKADETFRKFVSRYPRNPLAVEARKALSEPAQQAGLRTKVATAKPADGASSDVVDDDAPSSQLEEAPSGARLARVIAVRHWSTSEYARVAIDLERGVHFEAQRIDNPDRVFFDLLNSQLTAGLAGRSLEVEDGFVKKIRVSQFKAGRCRIVLDLDELVDYRASLQKNPPRLLIEVYNKNLQKQAGQDRPARTLAVSAASEGESSADETADASSPRSPGLIGSSEKVALPTACSTSDSSCDDTGEPGTAASSAALDNANDSGRTEPVEEKRGPPVHSMVTPDGVKRTVVEADTADEATAARLDPPELKPATKMASVPAAASLRNEGKSSSRSHPKTPAYDLSVREAQPTAGGDRSLIRALGLKIGKIVIDPGHGGHDTGTIGPNGLQEKDLVLDVSRRLGKLLDARLGAQVAYTRKDDTFIPLEDRTAIANREGADLFVSVHANSSHDPEARGVETYYLNFTTSPDALEVAARENAVSENSIHELQDLVKKIALKEKIEESHEFASDVQAALHGGLVNKNPGLRNRGVKKAPFIVLIGANMPSILAEISFVSNPADEHRLQTSEYRQRIAESLYRGIAKYVNGLSGVKVASKIEKNGTD